MNLFFTTVKSGSSLGDENFCYCAYENTVFEMPYGSLTFTRLRKIKSVLINILIKDDSNDAFWQMTHSLRWPNFCWNPLSLTSQGLTVRLMNGKLPSIIFFIAQLKLSHKLSSLNPFQIWVWKIKLEWKFIFSFQINAFVRHAHSSKTG